MELWGRPRNQLLALPSRDHGKALSLALSMVIWGPFKVSHTQWRFWRCEKGFSLDRPWNLGRLWMMLDFISQSCSTGRYWMQKCDPRGCPLFISSRVSGSGGGGGGGALLLLFWFSMFIRSGIGWCGGEKSDSSPGSDICDCNELLSDSVDDSLSLLARSFLYCVSLLVIWGLYGSGFGSEDLVIHKTRKIN